jgi:triacylglycerol lipase
MASLILWIDRGPSQWQLTRRPMSLPIGLPSSQDSSSRQTSIPDVYTLKLPGSRKGSQATSTKFQVRVCKVACIIFFVSTLLGISGELPSSHSTKAVTQTLIIDGIWGSHKRWERLRSRIESEVGPCRIWRYDNSGRASIESLGSTLSSQLQHLKAPVNLVGYSMGGLVIREALRQAPRLKVRRVVLLNSPNYGSAVAFLVPLSACREMRPGSAFLKQLNAAPWEVPTLATWCPYDLMVFPGSSGRWKKASVVLRSDVPIHLWPVVSLQIHRSITAFLASNEKPGVKPKR